MFNNDIKDKVRNISNDNAINISEKMLIGIIKSVDEISNTCSVNIRNQYGSIVNYSSIPVHIENNGSIGWFPSIGDKVYVKYLNGSYEIISLYTLDYVNKYKHKTDTPDNILTDFYNYTIGGYIF